MRRLPLLLLTAFGFANAGFSQQPYLPQPLREVSFDDGWQFHPGDSPGAEKPDFDDSGWRKLDLPHDFAIEGSFDQHSPAGGGGGYLTAGVAWYRKTFTVPDSEKEMLHTILFDGVYMDSDVYINGVHLGNHPYGYTSFYYELTPHLNYGGKPNVLAIRVNVKQPSSRWYSGAGIYRHVHLITTLPVHIEQEGVVVTTPEITPGSATISIRTRVVNDSGAEQRISVLTKIADPTGTLISIPHDPPSRGRWVYPDFVHAIDTQVVAPGATAELVQTIKIPKPHFWSPYDPAIYRVISDAHVYNGPGDHETYEFKWGPPADVIETPLGIRTIEFTADRGLLLNGKPCPIRGVCDHHDLGCLGSAAYRRGIERQLEILKSIGVNAIRTSHNPPSPELLDLCDSMGFLVMDEAFDEWKQSKTQFGYGRFFNASSEADLVSMVRRDRNHPSVVLWGIGNEIPEQNSPDGGKMAKRLAGIVRREDSTRPVTSACNSPGAAVKTGFADALDVLGINYNIADYNRWKGRPLVASETASAISSRGVYNLLPAADGKLEIKAEYDHQMSSYDTEVPGWATKVETSLQALRDCPWVAGQFVWTGFDYIGEPTPFGWPSRSSYFGIFDLCGFPKDRAYLYQSQWTTKPMAHLFPHWNWGGYEGREIPVRCYTNADSVELFLNGKSLGVRDWKDNRTLHLEWLVSYAPGILKAVATKDGKVAATDEIRTAGPPAKIELASDRKELYTNGQDLAFITARIEDKDGNLCPNAVNVVKLSITGPGGIAATDNGDPTDLASFQSLERKAFHGLALVVVKSIVITPGTDIDLKATAEGLAPATVKLITWHDDPPDEGWIRHSGSPK